MVIDARGMLLLPGVIDDHVHFRDPGLTHKADIASESRAAAAGGVTSYLDMPNTNPQTTTLPALEAKFQSASQSSVVNYSFFFGATDSNSDLISQLPWHRIPGVKLFMGSSTGNMLVDKEEALHDIFSRMGNHVLMVHCEDTATIDHNMQAAIKQYGPDVPISQHPDIRSVEACVKSTNLAIRMAEQHNTRLHIAHLTTRDELQLVAAAPDTVTAEACVSHLLFSSDDYATLGARIKCNPAVKSVEHRDALRQALTDGTITLVGTDHAPHLLSEKQGGAARAVSGMPMLQFSLPAMLELADRGILSLPRLVELMCHAPARLFGIEQRGYIRPGYKADLVLVQPNSPWEVTSDCIQSKCGWSPLEGHIFENKIRRTWVNGRTVYADGHIHDTTAAEALLFRS